LQAAHLALDAREASFSTVALIAGSTPDALRPVSQAQVAWESGLGCDLRVVILIETSASEDCCRAR
jgi:hypothetical protein